MNIAGILERCEVGGIKLGQFASTRYDLLPAGWIEQLSRLREQNRPVHLQLDESPFLYLDPVPIVTASIGQVYRGVLQTGEEVRGGDQSTKAGRGAADPPDYPAA